MLTKICHQAIRLTIPESLLLRAYEVIDRSMLNSS